MPWALSASEVARPAGPAPTTTTVPPRGRHLGQPVGGLQALGQGVLDEPHAAQLADHVDAGARRLEVLVDLGQVDAALGRAEDQPDGVDRALGGAAAVADAVVGVDQPRRVVDDAEDVALRAGLQAGEAADADVGIDDRVERAGQVLLLLHLLLEDLGVTPLAAAPAEVGQGAAQHRHGQRCDDDQ